MNLLIFYILYFSIFLVFYFLYFSTDKENAIAIEFICEILMIGFNCNF